MGIKAADKRRRITGRKNSAIEKMKQERDLKTKNRHHFADKAGKRLSLWRAKMTVMVLSTCFDIVIRFRVTSCIFIQDGFLHNTLCAHQLHRSVMPQCAPTISQPISWTFVLHWKPVNIQQTVIRCLPNHMVCRLSNCLGLHYRALWMNSWSEHAVLFSKQF